MLTPLLQDDNAIVTLSSSIGHTFKIHEAYMKEEQDFALQEYST
jgi:hypothetical protein